LGFFVNQLNIIYVWCAVFFVTRGQEPSVRIRGSFHGTKVLSKLLRIGRQIKRDTRVWTLSPYPARYLRKTRGCVAGAGCAVVVIIYFAGATVWFPLAFPCRGVSKVGIPKLNVHRARGISQFVQRKGGANRSKDFFHKGDIQLQKTLELWKLFPNKVSNYRPLPRWDWEMCGLVIAVIINNGMILQ
jgi:hypothetical protein